MTPPSLSTLVNEYLVFRRGLGFDLKSTEWLLRSFARYVDEIGHIGTVTTEVAVQWAMATTSSDPAAAGRRLSVVRQFARHREILDLVTEVPPAGLLDHPQRRKQPHIYSEAEMASLLTQAGSLRPRGGLRPKTYRALFSLLISTGLRLSEACHLMPRDVDLADGVLTVRGTKFQKSRLVPLHPTATEALIRYADLRDTARTQSGYFFRTHHSPALKRNTVWRTFSRIRDRLGWTTQGRAGRPRIHDLRHTFAVRRLLCWSQDGEDLDRKILALATYLGHAKVSATYWYLSAIPELMAVTSERFARFAQREQGRPS